MAKAGRRPKPAAARLREGGTQRSGTVSHRPAPTTALVEVAGRNVPVAPPDELPPDGRDLWEEVVRALATAGLLDRIDLPVLRVLCVQYARAWSAKRLIDEPVPEDELQELDDEIKTLGVIAASLKGKVANLLRAGVTPETKDLNAVANFAERLTSLKEYRRILGAHGRIVALGSMGQIAEHPLLATERHAASLILRYAGALAITPTDRARLGLLIVDLNKGRRDLDQDIGARPKR